MRAGVECWEVFRASEGDRVMRWAIVLEALDWKPLGLFFEDMGAAIRACEELGLDVLTPPHATREDGSRDDQSQ